MTRIKIIMHNKLRRLSSTTEFIVLLLYIISTIKIKHRLIFRSHAPLDFEIAYTLIYLQFFFPLFKVPNTNLSMQKYELLLFKKY